MRRLIVIAAIALVLALPRCLYFALQSRPLRPEGWPTFSDGREGSGIRFKYAGSPTKEKYLIETMGGGVGILDYNNDGRLDIFLVNGGKLQDPMPLGSRVGRAEPEYFNRLYRNNGDGTFSDVTLEAGVSGAQDGNYGMGVATGDFDNDGFVDLYVTNFMRNILYRNNGDGTFRNITDQAGVEAGGWSVSAGFFDFANDGWLDLFVARYLDWDFSKNIPCGVPFTAYCSPEKFEPISNLLYHNNRDGTFSDVSTASGIGRVLSKGLGVAFNDYNQDGLMDICVACDRVPQLLFHNNGDGTFRERGLEAGLALDEDGGVFSGMGIDFSDFNNDGLPDVLITTLAKEMYAFYRNDGHGRYSYATRPTQLGMVSMLMSRWGTRFVDFDDDGWKDLFVAQGHVLDNIDRIDPTRKYLQAPLLSRNEKGKFKDVSLQSGPVFQQPVAGRGAAFGDLDNDGDIDVVMGVLNDFPRILYNDASTRSGHWLLIKLSGTVSNRDGIGAQVKVEGGSGLTQWASVSTSGSYLSSSDKRVHFGLGSDELIKTIEVKWPSGITQELKNVKANQILMITEPNFSRQSRQDS